MRVLHVTPYFAPAFRYGGPPRSILGLCRALGEAGVDVEVFTTTANGPEPLPAVPVVVAKRSGWADVEKMGCGFSVSNEPVAIADGLLRILDRPAEAAAMGERGRAWARQTFAWDSIGRAMRDAYENVLVRSPRQVA